MRLTCARHSLIRQSAAHTRIRAFALYGCFVRARSSLPNMESQGKGTPCRQRKQAADSFPQKLRARSQGTTASWHEAWVQRGAIPACFTRSKLQIQTGQTCQTCQLRSRFSLEVSDNQRCHNFRIWNGMVLIEIPVEYL